MPYGIGPGLMQGVLMADVREPRLNRDCESPYFHLVSE